MNYFNTSSSKEDARFNIRPSITGIQGLKQINLDIWRNNHIPTVNTQAVLGGLKVAANMLNLGDQYKENEDKLKEYLLALKTPATLQELKNFQFQMPNAFNQKQELEHGDFLWALHHKPIKDFDNLTDDDKDDIYRNEAFLDMLWKSYKKAGLGLTDENGNSLFDVTKLPEPLQQAELFKGDNEETFDYNKLTPLLRDDIYWKTMMENEFGDTPEWYTIKNLDPRALIELYHDTELAGTQYRNKLKAQEEQGKSSNYFERIGEEGFEDFKDKAKTYLNIKDTDNEDTTELAGDEYDFLLSDKQKEERNHLLTDFGKSTPRKLWEAFNEKFLVPVSELSSVTLGYKHIYEGDAVGDLTGTLLGAVFGKTWGAIAGHYIGGTDWKSKYDENNYSDIIDKAQAKSNTLMEETVENSATDSYNKLLSRWANTPDFDKDVNDLWDMFLKDNPQWQAFKDQEEMQHIDAREKLQLLTTAQAISLTYSPEAGYNYLNSKINDTIANEYGTDFIRTWGRGIVPKFLSSTVESALSLYKVANDGLALATAPIDLETSDNFQKRADNFILGLDDDGKMLSAPFNMRYWDGVDKYGAYDPEMVREILYGTQVASEIEQQERTGNYQGTGVSIYKPPRATGDEFDLFSARGISDAMEMAGYIGSLAFVGKALPKAKSVFRGAGDLTKINTLGRMTGAAGLNLLRKMGVGAKARLNILSSARATGRYYSGLKDAAIISTPISVGYGYTAFEEVFQKGREALTHTIENQLDTLDSAFSGDLDSINKIAKYKDNYSDDFIQRYLTAMQNAENDAKQNIQNEIEEAYKNNGFQVDVESPEFKNRVSLEIAEAKKLARQEFIDTEINEYRNDDLEKIRLQAIDGFNLDFGIELARNVGLGMAFNRVLYKSPRAKIINGPDRTKLWLEGTALGKYLSKKVFPKYKGSLQATKIDNEGNLVRNTGRGRKWAEVFTNYGNIIRQGFWSNYMDDVTVGYATGFNLNDTYNIINAKYGDDSFDDVLRYQSSFLAGMSEATNKMMDPQSFYDGFIGALGSIVSFNPVLAYKGVGALYNKIKNGKSKYNNYEIANFFLGNQALGTLGVLKDEHTQADKRLDSINKNRGKVADKLSKKIEGIGDKEILKMGFLGLLAYFSKLAKKGYDEGDIIDMEDGEKGLMFSVVEFLHDAIEEAGDNVETNPYAGMVQTLRSLTNSSSEAIINSNKYKRDIDAYIKDPQNKNEIDAIENRIKESQDADTEQAEINAQVEQAKKEAAANALKENARQIINVYDNYRKNYRKLRGAFSNIVNQKGGHDILVLMAYSMTMKKDWSDAFREAEKAITGKDTFNKNKSDIVAWKSPAAAAEEIASLKKSVNRLEQKRTVYQNQITELKNWKKKSKSERAESYNSTLNTFYERANQEDAILVELMKEQLPKYSATNMLRKQMINSAIEEVSMLEQNTEKQIKDVYKQIDKVEKLNKKMSKGLELKTGIQYVENKQRKIIKEADKIDKKIAEAEREGKQQLEQGIDDSENKTTSNLVAVEANEVENVTNDSEINEESTSEESTNLENETPPVTDVTEELNTEKTPKNPNIITAGEIYNLNPLDRAELIGKKEKFSAAQQREINTFLELNRDKDDFELNIKKAGELYSRLLTLDKFIDYGIKFPEKLLAYGKLFRSALDGKRRIEYLNSEEGQRESQRFLMRSLILEIIDNSDAKQANELNIIGKTLATLQEKYFEEKGEELDITNRGDVMQAFDKYIDDVETALSEDKNVYLEFEDGKTLRLSENREFKGREKAKTRGEDNTASELSTNENAESNNESTSVRGLVQDAVDNYNKYLKDQEKQTQLNSTELVEESTEKEIPANQSGRYSKAENGDENYFEIQYINYKGVSYDIVRKKTRDGSQTNAVLRVFINDELGNADYDKGWFELVKDNENGEYSLHFKTNNGKYGDQNTKSSTRKERGLLYKAAIAALPTEAKVSTRGELSEGGFKAISNLDKKVKGLIKLEETRDITMGNSGETRQIPVYKKQKPSRKPTKDKAQILTERVESKTKEQIQKVSQPHTWDEHNSVRQLYEKVVNDTGGVKTQKLLSKIAKLREGKFDAKSLIQNPDVVYYIPNKWADSIKEEDRQESLPIIPLVEVENAEDSNISIDGKYYVALGILPRELSLLRRAAVESYNRGEAFVLKPGSNERLSVKIKKVVTTTPTSLQSGDTRSLSSIILNKLGITQDALKEIGFSIQDLELSVSDFLKTADLTAYSLNLKTSIYNNYRDWILSNIFRVKNEESGKFELRFYPNGFKDGRYQIIVGKTADSTSAIVQLGNQQMSVLQAIHLIATTKDKTFADELFEQSAVLRGFKGKIESVIKKLQNNDNGNSLSNEELDRLTKSLKRAFDDLFYYKYNDKYRGDVTFNVIYVPSSTDNGIDRSFYKIEANIHRQGQQDPIKIHLGNITTLKDSNEFSASCCDILNNFLYNSKGILRNADGIENTDKNNPGSPDNVKLTSLRFQIKYDAFEQIEGNLDDVKLNAYIEAKERLRYFNIHKEERDNYDNSQKASDYNLTQNAEALFDDGMLSAVHGDMMSHDVQLYSYIERKGKNQTQNSPSTEIEKRTIEPDNADTNLNKSTLPEVPEVKVGPKLKVGESATRLAINTLQLAVDASRPIIELMRERAKKENSTPKKHLAVTDLAHVAQNDSQDTSGPNSLAGLTFGNKVDAIKRILFHQTVDEKGNRIFDFDFDDPSSVNRLISKFPNINEISIRRMVAAAKYIINDRFTNDNIVAVFTDEILVDTTIEVDIDGKEVLMPVKGIIDMATVDDKGQIRIYDFKTYSDTSDFLELSFDVYSNQTNAYRLGMQKQYGITVFNTYLVPTQTKYEKADSFDDYTLTGDTLYYKGKLAVASTIEGIRDTGISTLIEEGFDLEGEEQDKTFSPGGELHSKLLMLGLSPELIRQLKNGELTTDSPIIQGFNTVLMLTVPNQDINIDLSKLSQENIDKINKIIGDGDSKVDNTSHINKKAEGELGVAQDKANNKIGTPVDTITEENVETALKVDEDLYNCFI